ncbi:MAG: hypothetical protein HYY17_00655 [Planctomycetes bacterium]|nr:hypothetical protein [Planctomycetota bacterium]
MDLCNLQIGEPEKLIAELDPRLRACRTVGEASTLLSSELYDRCRCGATQERALVLSRVYLSLPFSTLDAGGQAFAREKFGLQPAPRDLFLALVGTHGDRPEWCDRAKSNGHRAIPLNRTTVATVPMLARCFQQIGFDLDVVLKPGEGIHTEGVSRSFGLFHVEQALGSPFVPAQEDFVKSCGVQSVLGCGTMLPDGAVSIWIGFLRGKVTQQAAVPLIPMMPSFWHVVQPIYRRRSLFAA